MKKMFNLTLLALLLLALVPLTASAQEEVVCAEEITVQKDDWLSKYADKYLGNVQSWPAIMAWNNKAAQANPDKYDKIGNADLIVVGWSICVPSAEDADAFLAEYDPSKPEMLFAGSEGGTLVIGTGAGSFDRMDPNVTTMTPVGNITILMADPLLWQVDTGKFAPGLATEWTVNEDATEYRFKLRDDVKFHDGTPLNAEAVKFMFDRIADPEWKSQMAFSLIGPYKETEVINDYEFVVRFNSPYAPFLDSVSQPYLAPVSPTMVEEQGVEGFGLTTFAGTGPYMLESMVIDSEYVLTRNPDYDWGPAEWGMNKPAKLDKIIFKPIAEEATQVAALLTGEIDYLDEVPPVDWPDLVANPDINTVAIEQAGMGEALMFNHENPPTDELAIRRAMQLAMDKEGMIATVKNGIGTPACSLVTKVTYGFCPELCDMYTFDLDAANQVLEDAGWVDSDGDGIREKDGQPLVVHHYFRGDIPAWVDMGAFAKDNFAKIGIDYELHGLTSSGYFDAVRSGQHNTQGWWEKTTDPDMFIRGVLHSSNAGGGTNRNNLRDPEMDAMVDEAAGEPDVEKRAQLYCELLKEVKDQAHMEIWIDPMGLFAHRADLSGIEYYMAGSFPYYASAFYTE
jgi:peptide/nickel transport system substrate-binding protein